MSAELRSLADLYVTPGPAVATESLPKVLVVVLNYNGRHHLQRCFESLRALDYPSERLEVLLVDNGSEDGSVEEMRTRFPWVRLIQNPRNYGFAPACNQGAANRRDAQVVTFLNNDMRVDPQWLRELVAPIVRGECSATTSKMLSWDGSRIDSAGGGMNFHGHGLQYGYGDVPAAEHERSRRTLFACGGAMAIDAGVFESLGGFDREYFAYYEDVDLGWRTWLAGHEVHYVPTSTCCIRSKRRDASSSHGSSARWREWSTASTRSARAAARKLRLPGWRRCAAACRSAARACTGQSRSCVRAA